MENLDAQLRKLLVATESLVFYRKALTGHTYMVSKSLGKDTNIHSYGNFFRRSGSRLFPQCAFVDLGLFWDGLFRNDLFRLRIRFMPQKQGRANKG